MLQLALKISCLVREDVDTKSFCRHDSGLEALEEIVDFWKLFCAGWELFVVLEEVIKVVGLSAGFDLHKLVTFLKVKAPDKS